jgi:hypothetical protein
VVQPEVIADTIFHAALNPKREYLIGQSTLKVILGNMVLPAFLDRLLAHAAYESQMTKSPVMPHRRDNLEAPVSDLHRTRGSFGREAHQDAVVMSGRSARTGVVLAGLALAFCAGALSSRYLTRAKPQYRLPPPR